MLEIDSAMPVQMLYASVCNSHHTNTLWKSGHLTILPSTMDRVDQTLPVGQPVNEKENSKFKPTLPPNRSGAKYE